MISDRIKKMREENRMTQTQLGKKLGVTRASVNAWEMGISVPSVQFLVELSRIFKVSVDYLLELDNSVKVDIGYLNTEQRETILNLLNQFKKHNETVDLLNIKTDGRSLPDYLWDLLQDDAIRLKVDLSRFENLKDVREDTNKENDK